MPLLRILLGAYHKFDRDDGFALASHIALSALTSLFPFLIFLTALAGFFGKKEIAEAATKILFEAWPERVAGPISREIQSVLTQPSAGRLTFGAVFAIYFSSSGVESLRIALNRAYDAIEIRPWWVLRLKAILFVFVGALSLLVISFLLVLAPLAKVIAEHYAPVLVRELAPLYGPVRYGVTTAVLGAAALSAHLFLPARRPPLLKIAPGLVLTLIVSIAFGAGFGAYLAEFAINYVSTYAGLASIMIALVFLNALAAIFIFGAELNQAIAGDAPQHEA